MELQKAKQNYFKDRTVFYSTFPIREQAEAGSWDFAPKAVYCIGIFDFVFNEPAGGSGAGEVLHEVKLKSQHGAVFYDKLTYYYLEMPNFRKTEAELTSRLDQWLYFLKHLEELQSIPQLFRDEVFTQAFETAAIAQMSISEWEQYEGSLKSYRDEINTVQTARQEGIQQGIEAGKKTQALIIAAVMKAAGIALALIAQTTGLSLAEVDAFP